MNINMRFIFICHWRKKREKYLKKKIDGSWLCGHTYFLLPCVFDLKLIMFFFFSDIRFALTNVNCIICIYSYACLPKHILGRDWIIVLPLSFRFYWTFFLFSPAVFDILNDGLQFMLIKFKHFFLMLLAYYFLKKTV